jgi:light-independent protochlorophyllide reductase subunit B
VNVVAPAGASPDDIARIADADFNVVLYPEIADSTARWLERQYGQKRTTVVPIGLGATREFVAEVARLAGVDPAPLLADEPTNMPWWTRSVDSTYLTGKRVFVFGDATHAVAMARVAAEEMGFEVVGLGAYNREFARDVRAAAAKYGVEPLITEDYLEVEAAIAAAHPELVMGTQMERHIAKRLGLPCAVISAPVHVQDFPARYAPVMGFEGANVLFDTLVHPLVMGLEEHLLHMFRDDFEFHDEAGPSHLHGARRAAAPEPDAAAPEAAAPTPEPVHLDAAQGSAAAPGAESTAAGPIVWRPEAEKELKKIPFFVRGKARRNTEAFATQRGLTAITVETLYDAKAHFAR